MKKIMLSACFALFSIGSFAQSQDLPNTQIRDISGKQIAFNDAFEKGKVTLVSFWATWCIPCKQEIKNIKDKLGDWQKETSFNYMTISIDDARSTAMVKTYAKSQGWNFPAYTDPNADLKRSLNFQNIPYAIIVDQNGKIVYQHSGYEEGGEYELFDRIKALNKK